MFCGTPALLTWDNVARMTAWTRRIPFQVDVAGVIQIMGTSLYARGDAPIRELIQNAHDAILRRRQKDLSYKGRIDIRLDSERHTVSFHDDGVGLSPDEAEKYLGTLGIGITGFLKGRHPDSAGADVSGNGDGLIGQFGIGLFSAFMVADRLVVESRRLDCDEGVCWSAGEGTEIELSSLDRAHSGTTVTLHLKPEHHRLAERSEVIETAIKEYADFLPIPIFLNDAPRRVNVINVAWFDPTPEREAIELELQGYFHESPLDVIPVRAERPVSVVGALYVTPQRTPGFAGDPVVTTTIRRMVISRQTRDLLPPWASFLRGVLEVSDCVPTASREDLVRDAAFAKVKAQLEELLFSHFEQLATKNLAAMEAILSWHRYTLAGAALGNARLRRLLRETYRFHTSQGMLSFSQILSRSTADPLFETEFDVVVWHNTDRRQERWISSLFADGDTPCVHTIRSFEESLLATLLGDVAGEGQAVDLRITSPSSPSFAAQILGIHDVEDAPAEWQEFLASTDAKILTASFRDDLPVMAFLNEKHELQRTYDEMRKYGSVPAGFQRLIDAHFEQSETARNEILLNRSHRLVGRALSQRTGTPLASVLRLLVLNALTAAGAAVPHEAQREHTSDLDWIAEALWGRGS
jgi:molecular chaperone HtpG